MITCLHIISWLVAILNPILLVIVRFLRMFSCKEQWCYFLCLKKINSQPIILGIFVIKRRYKWIVKFALLNAAAYGFVTWTTSNSQNLFSS